MHAQHGYVGDDYFLYTLRDQSGQVASTRVTIFVVAADEGLDAIDYLFQMLG